MNTAIIPFQTEVAQNYGDFSEALWANVARRGSQMLRKAGVETRSPDLQFLGYLLWRGLTEDRWDDDYIVVGDISDQVSDKEAELLVELEPALQKRVGAPAGAMSPEVTALHDLLLEVSAVSVDRWKHRRDEEDLGPE